MQPKLFFQSKTIIGGVLMALPLVLSLCHVSASDAEIAQAGTDLTSAVQGITGLVGFILVIVGRVKANGPIKNPLG